MLGRHGAQEMGETYNMMMELLLTAGSSSSSGGSSPDVVVGEIAKDRTDVMSWLGMLCLQYEPMTSHRTPCASNMTKYQTSLAHLSTCFLGYAHNPTCLFRGLTTS